MRLKMNAAVFFLLGTVVQASLFMLNNQTFRFNPNTILLEILATVYLILVILNRHNQRAAAFWVGMEIQTVMNIFIYLYLIVHLPIFLPEFLNSGAWWMQRFVLDVQIQTWAALFSAVICLILYVTLTNISKMVRR